MKILLVTSLLWLSGFLFHAITCRLSRRIKKSPQKLIFLYGSLYSIFIIFEIQSHYFRLDLFDLLHLSLAFWTLTVSYFFFFHGLVEKSPTMKIMKAAALSTPQGVTREELLTVFNDKEIMTRLKYLIDANLVTISEDKYFLSKKGELLLNRVQILRSLINLQKEVG